MKKAMLRFLSFVAPLLVTATALAEEASSATNELDVQMIAYLAAGFGIAVAAFGGALGQARAAAAALEGIARNPNAADKLFTPMILGLALIESLVIYALVIAIMLVMK